LTVSNKLTHEWFTGAGTDTEFTVPFDYLQGETSCIGVLAYDTTDPENYALIPFALGSEYIIDESSFPETKVVTTDPLPVNRKLYIYRQTEEVQNTSVESEYTFPAESMQDYMDRTTYLLQELFAITNRAILNSPESIEAGTGIELGDIFDKVKTIVKIDLGTTTSYDANANDVISVTNDIDVLINLPVGEAKDTITVYANSSGIVTIVGTINGITNYEMASNNPASVTLFCLSAGDWIII